MEVKQSRKQGQERARFRKPSMPERALPTASVTLDSSCCFKAHAPRAKNQVPDTLIVAQDGAPVEVPLSPTDRIPQMPATSVFGINEYWRADPNEYQIGQGSFGNERIPASTHRSFHC